MASRSRKEAEASSSAASKRKREASEPECIVLSDDDDEAGAKGAREGGARKRRGAAVAPPPNLKELLGRLDQLHSTSEAVDNKTVKRSPGKGKRSAKAAPVRGWSKGTGFGGSHELSQREHDLQMRARAREEDLDSSVASVFQQLVIALEREQASSPKSDPCFQLQSCAGLGWAIHRFLSNQSMLDIGQRSTPFKQMLALLSYLARGEHRDALGKHIYAPLFITPLQRKGWAGVPQHNPTAGEEVSDAASSSKVAEAPRRSQRAIKGKESAEAIAGEPSEVDLASMDTAVSLLSSLKSQVSVPSLADRF